MKKTNKKGFTIVELVIVIAVIAILAAVLIPTFAGVVEKANKSAALQAAKNAYVEDLAAYNGNYSAVIAKDTVVDGYTVQGTFAFSNGAVTSYIFTGNTNYDVVYTTTAGTVDPYTSLVVGWNVVAKVS